MLIHLLTGLILFGSALLPLYAQQNANDYTLQLKKASDKINLDGILSEQAWVEADVADAFHQSRPNDQNAAYSKTEAKVTYDDKFLYIGAVCYNSIETGDYVVQSLKRDFSFPITDAFAVFLDPINNQTAGFSFAVSPLGVQREGLVLGGGNDGVTTSWDNKWFSKVTRHPDKWVVEMAIPFKSLRYNSQLSVWGINFARNDLKQPETSTWKPVPTQFNVANLAFTGQLNWDKPPKKSGANVAFIPYISGGVQHDIENNETPEFQGPKVGFDAKVALTSSLNLDITVNPDFSQVEVDRQVTNLERFSIFFPERRQFFIENSDLFRFGIPPIRPFFSRTIGLKSGQIVPILAGLRLTGNVSEKWRVGAMSIQTEGVKNENLDFQSQNYSVATVQRSLHNKRSNVMLFGLSRQAFDNVTPDQDDFNRVLGGETILRSDDNKWETFVQYQQTFTRYDSTTFMGKWWRRAGGLLGTAYEGRHLFALVSLEYLGQDYRSDMGFLRQLFHRNDEEGSSEAIPYTSSFHYIGYRFFPKQNKHIRFYGLRYEGNVLLNTANNLSLTERSSSMRAFVNFNDGSSINANVGNYATQLYFPTNITGVMDSLLQADLYNYTEFWLNGQLSKRYKFYGNASIRYGGFYNGKKLTLNSDLNYRLQPWGNIGLSFAYNDVRFPVGYGDAKLLLLGPRFELTFTRSVFLTTFLQYNTQADNFNINSRLQWRFAPMSDLFVVFTDNLNPTNFEQKNWGVVLKLNYWLSL